MTKEEFDKYVDCVMSMCLDYKMDGITKETLIQNLKIVMEHIKQ